jgi:hypothetical protein
MPLDYRQFVDDRVIEIVRIGVGERDIKASRHSDFNDINPRQWDLVAPAVSRYIAPVVKAAGLPLTISLLIAIQKEAARFIRAERGAK